MHVTNAGTVVCVSIYCKTLMCNSSYLQLQEGKWLEEDTTKVHMRRGSERIGEEQCYLACLTKMFHRILSFDS